MKKLIFLDIDGVLNKKSQWSRPYSLADDCIEQLAKLVKETGALVILVSTWKTGLDIPDNKIVVVEQSENHTEQINRLIGKLEQYGVGISGKTSHLPGRTRDREIERFLYFVEASTYVILDDDMSIYDSKEHIIKINENTGLTGSNVRNVMKLLK